MMFKITLIYFDIIFIKFIDTIIIVCIFNILSYYIFNSVFLR